MGCPLFLESGGVQASRCGGFSCCRAWALGCSGFSTCGSGLCSRGSIVVAYRLSCFTACGSLPNQGSNPRLLHWQANSLPGKRHQGSPKQISFDLQNIWLFFHGFHFRFQALCFFIQRENFCLLSKCSDYANCTFWIFRVSFSPLTSGNFLTHKTGLWTGDPLKFFEVLRSSLLSGTRPYKYFYWDITVI